MITAGFSAEQPYDGAISREPVALVRLDDDMAGIERLDLLKIDAEGFGRRGAACLGLGRGRPLIAASPGLAHALRRVAIERGK